jgi:hypothetical protein
VVETVAQVFPQSMDVHQRHVATLGTRTRWAAATRRVVEAGSPATPCVSTSTPTCLCPSRTARRVRFRVCRSWWSATHRTAPPAIDGSSTVTGRHAAMRATVAHRLATCPVVACLTTLDRTVPTSTADRTRSPSFPRPHARATHSRASWHSTPCRRGVPAAHSAVAHAHAQ